MAGSNFGLFVVLDDDVKVGNGCPANEQYYSGRGSLAVMSFLSVLGLPLNLDRTSTVLCGLFCSGLYF